MSPAARQPVEPLDATSGTLVVVTGGARSGKSRYARLRAEARPGPWLYIATAEAGDDEMRARIDRHRAERGAGWTTVEAPRDPAGALRSARSVAAVVVDCLTLWTSNLLLDGTGDQAIESAAADLADAARASAAAVFLVTNEVGMGVVPEHPVGRRFRDVAGRVNQVAAAAASELWLLVAGQPLRVK
jgi:adenosylcobinamide kinase/adenosylcobinamide-phosphate guanylyltransferase